jgi:dTDP-glucose pyrophosphorylase
MVRESSKKDYSMSSKYSKLMVGLNDTILNVLKKMDSTNRKLLIVMNDDIFKSLISIGDIQRAIIKGVELSSPIYNILREDITIATTNEEVSKVKERMRVRRNELMPVVSPSGQLVDVIFWEDLFQEERKKAIKPLKLPVIIMAGGQGTRLKPLTNVLPKALIPIKNKTMIEEIMDRFLSCGCRNFFISVNYKAEMIQYYFKTLQNREYRIKYIREEKPLGTAGSLFLLKDKINTTFFVTNCDILVDQDYDEILKYHINNKNEITIVAALKNYAIPYGTLTSHEDGLLKSLQEKPEYTYKINTGLYILEPHLLNEVPQNEPYHITDLIEKLLALNRRVGVFPVSDNSWIDIGSLQEYKFRPE